MVEKLLDKKIEDDFQVKSKPVSSSILLKRARAKYFTLSMVIPLANLGSPLMKSYWNTFHCARELEQEGNKISGSYCKNRWCIVCNRIRTAVLIGKYSDEINSWDDKHFLTLTIPNCSENDLFDTIKKMQTTFKKISWVIKKKKIDFVCLKKLECTYNPLRNDYHPHYHLICKTKLTSEEIKKEWLKRYPEAEHFLQDIRPADSNSVFELFKYFSKVITSVKDEKDLKLSPSRRRKIYIDALDIIFQSVAGIRTFQVFGFKGKNIDEKVIETVETSEFSAEKSTFIWEKEINDWVNKSSGQVLTGFEPSDSLKHLVDSDIVINEASLRLGLGYSDSYKRYWLARYDIKKE